MKKIYVWTIQKIKHAAIIMLCMLGGLSALGQTPINNISDLATACSSGGSYILTTSLAISTEYSITASSNVSIDGGGYTITQTTATTRHFNLNTANRNLTLYNITLNGNNTGGGIIISQTATLYLGSAGKTTVIQNCRTATGTTSHGGAILANGSNRNVVLAGNVIISGNTAGGSGGGIYKGNATGSISVSGTTTTLTMQNNTAGVSGGAIYSVAALNLSDLLYGYLNNNTAATSGGGIYAEAALNVKNIYFQGNQANATANTGGGGGVFTASTATTANNIQITACTFHANSAGTTTNGFGGGAHFRGLAVVINSTFYANTAGANGGGAIYTNNNGTRTLTARLSTFNANTPNAIQFASNTTTGSAFTGNIIYGNGTGVDVNTAPATATYNIVRAATATVWTNTANYNQLYTTNGHTAAAANIFANVISGATAQLANNGGSTPTIAIKQGGLAHNQIPTGLAWLTTSDQRGMERPQGTLMDIGAFERFLPPTLCWGETLDVEAEVENADTVYAKWITGYEGTGNIPTPALINNKTELIWSYTAQAGDKDTIKAIIYSDALPSCDPDTVWVEFYTKDCSVPNYANLLTCTPSTPINMKEHHPECTTLEVTSVTAASGATAQAVDSTVVYSHNGPGKDTVNYTFTCNGTPKSGTLYITVAKCPDNVVPGCHSQVIPQTWTVQPYRSIDTLYSTYITPMVGDIDGCGIPEILVGYDIWNDAEEDPWQQGGGAGQPGAYRGIKKIAVFHGNDISAPYLIINLERGAGWDRMTPFGIVKTEIGGKDTVLIVVAETDRYMRAYNNQGTRVWTSSEMYHSATNLGSGNIAIVCAAPSFADFDHDGIPEILIKGKIFNSSNGQLRCAAPDPPFRNAVPIAADLFGTGELNFVLGNRIYTPNASLTNLAETQFISIPINTSDPDFISFGMGSSAPFEGAGNHYNDGGMVSAIDIDGCGQLELIYALSRNNFPTQVEQGEALIAIVNPRTGATIASKYIPQAQYISWPLVGDIDGCGNPEIVFITSRLNPSANPELIPQEIPFWNMYALKYVPGDPILKQFWKYPHTDPSGETVMTLFDFNMDGIMEIVYRDEEELRIINGSLISHITGNDTITPYNLSSFYPNTSGTGMENPVVADVDNCGQAEIVIVSGTATGRPRFGPLWVFKSGNPWDNPWAPARPVWNQYPYHVLNVNKDLSVPTHEASPASIFPNGKKPYNNFFQQQTLLNEEGDPYWPAPDIVWETELNLPPVGIWAGDSVTISGCIKNTGSAPLEIPIYVTFYENDTIPANILTYDSLVLVLPVMPDSVKCFEIVLNNLSSYGDDISAIWISVNDKNGIYPYQRSCNVDGRWKFQMSLNREEVATCWDSIMFNVIEYFEPVPCATPNIVITSTSPLGATVVARDSIVVYKYPRDINGKPVTGKDKIQYHVYCDEHVLNGQIFLAVTECPDNVDTVDCWVKPTAHEWSLQETSTIANNYSNYQCAMVGDVDGCGIPEILVGMDPGEKHEDPRILQKIAILKGDDINASPRIITTVAGYEYGRITKYGIVKTEINSKDTVLIVVAEADGSVRAYSYDNKLVWTSNQPYGNENTAKGIYYRAPSFADFDSDGIPEVIVGGKIFNSQTGHFRCAPNPYIEFEYNNAFAVDLFNTGRLNLIVGNKIYTPNAALTQLDLVKTFTSFSVNPNDPALSLPQLNLSLPRPDFETNFDANKKGGHIVVADLDNDGQLEIIYMITREVTGTDNVGTTYEGEALLVVVDPTADTVKATKYFPYAPMCSWPLVGDIDRCGKPEIVFISSRLNDQNAEQTYKKMHAYRYDGTPILEKFWEVDHQDPSGETGMTLFDFNQDGIMEIVYRDEQHIRIINGSQISHKTGGDTTVYNLTYLTNTSGTGAEYPVIADVDGDGQAEIVIVGGSVNDRPAEGSLHVYKSGDPHTNPWAPARPVWNQHAYNALHIHEDLTVPKYQMSPTIVFPGENGVPVRPFNAFFQQQTYINTDGIPFMPAANIVWINRNDTVPKVVIAGDSAIFKGCIQNIGNAAMQTPLYYTIYKNDTLMPPGAVLRIDSINRNMKAGEIICFEIVLKGLTNLNSSSDPLTSVWISINEKDGMYPYQLQCEVNGRWEFDIEIPEACPEFDLPTMKIKMKTPSSQTPPPAPTLPRPQWQGLDGGKQ